jgi:protein ImuB
MRGDGVVAETGAGPRAGAGTRTGAGAGDPSRSPSRDRSRDRSRSRNRSPSRDRSRGRSRSRSREPDTEVQSSEASRTEVAQQALQWLPQPEPRPDTEPETDEPTLACVLLAALPLQILAQRQPDLRELPAVVLTEDRPQGLILWTNRKARAAGVLPGMRYATALAMEPALRGGVVAQEAVQAALDEVGGLLRQFSPRLEPEPQEPGVFWLDTAGLTGLFGSLQDWASQLHNHLLAAHWHATVAVGWRRFALYAIARHRRGVQVCTDTAEEQRWRDRVPLASLGQVFALPPAVRDAVAKLGVKTLGEYLALPALQLQERYGTEARASHKLASDAVVQPLRPQLPQPPPHACRDLEPADDNRERLLFVLRGLLGGLLREVAVRRQSVAGLLLTLHLEVPRQDLARDSNGEALARPVLARLLHEVLQPAEPTLQEAQLTDLLRLRLEQLVLVAGVERLELTLQTVPASADQLRLWQLAGKRNLDAATAALARVRAAFGPQAVLQAVLRPEHLPHARFGWLPRDAVLPALPLASSGGAGAGPPAAGGAAVVAGLAAADRQRRAAGLRRCRAAAGSPRSGARCRQPTP